LATSTANQQAIASAVAHYNSLLQSGLDTFKSANPGLSSNTQVVDTQAVFNPMLDNPTYYGIPNASCFNADGVSCMWWNNYHPGQALQQAVGDQVSNEVGGFTLE